MYDSEFSGVKNVLNLTRIPNQKNLAQRIREAITPVNAAKIKAEVDTAKTESLINITKQLEIIGIPQHYAISLAYDIQQGAKHLSNISSIIDKAEANIDSDGNVPDAEFCNSFRHFAQNVSNEEMQQKWADLLSAECKHNGTFSPRALSIFATMATREARLFDTFCSVSTGGFTPEGIFVRPIFYMDPKRLNSHSHWDGSISDAEIRELAALGLVTPGMVISIDPTVKPFKIRVGQAYVDLIPKGSTKPPVKVDAVLFNEPAIELARLCGVGAKQDFTQRFVQAASNWGFDTRIEMD